jgi:hypothetical protein
VFPVRYELNSYILFGTHLVFNGLTRMKALTRCLGRCMDTVKELMRLAYHQLDI